MLEIPGEKHELKAHEQRYYRTMKGKKHTSKTVNNALRKSLEVGSKESTISADGSVEIPPKVHKPPGLPVPISHLPKMTKTFNKVKAKRGSTQEAYSRTF